MPKEVFGNKYAAIGDNADTPLVAEVHWERGSGYVQVATVKVGADVGSPERGWFVDLDRNGINRMIRALRRARDQAYGADA